jgi:hypothetical protein
MYQLDMASEQYDAETAAILKDIKNIISRAHDLYAKLYDVTYNKTDAQVAVMDQFSSKYPTVDGDEGVNLAKRIAYIADLRNTTNAMEEFKTLWDTMYPYFAKFI